MKIKRGDIFMSNLIGKGHMQVGTRPVVIVSNWRANDYSDTVTVVPCTTSPTKAKLPTHVRMNKKSKTHDLYGIALAECIITIDKSMLIRKMGYCSANEMLRISIAMLIQLGINIFEIIKDCTIDMFKCLKEDDKNGESVSDTEDDRADII